MNTFKLTLLFGLSLVLPTIATDLEHGFQKPPPETRPWVYWYFMDGNLSREGITADLEAMRETGIGGAIFLEVDLGIPRGPVKFMSPEWQQLLVYAVHESERLGINLALAAGPHWCGTGGPSVKPEQSMQHLMAGETNVNGPAKFDGILSRPPGARAFFWGKGLSPRSWRKNGASFIATWRQSLFPRLKPICVWPMWRRKRCIIGPRFPRLPG
jgi:hypothetical protein